MNLCSINIPLQINYEKIAANRIIEPISDFQFYDYPDIAGLLSGKIYDSIGILDAIKSGNPCDIKNNLIDKNTVNKELYILSKSLLGIKLLVDQKINEEPAGSDALFYCRAHTVGEQVVIINDLAKEMFVKSLNDDPAALLFLMNKYDPKNNINKLLPELQKAVIGSYINVQKQEVGFE
jgi:hypothetical protein